jgi:hypothetical protein
MVDHPVQESVRAARHFSNLSLSHRCASDAAGTTKSIAPIVAMVSEGFVRNDCA